MPVILVQLVGNVREDEVTPKYDVKDIREFRERQESPQVDFYGFGNVPEDYRERMLQYVGNSYSSLRELGIFVVDNLRIFNLDSIRKELQEDEKTVTNMINYNAPDYRVSDYFTRIHELEDSLKIYDTFSDNVSRSRVERMKTSGAQGIVNIVRAISRTPYTILDYESINKDLLKAYGLEGKESE